MSALSRIDSKIFVMAFWNSDGQLLAQKVEWSINNGHLGYRIQFLACLLGPDFRSNFEKCGPFLYRNKENKFFGEETYRP